MQRSVKRTFLAVNITPSAKLKEDFELVRYRLRLERINWLPDNNLHITLSFLGDTDDALLAGIAQSVERITNSAACFNLSLHTFGVFKNLRDPRVIWIGCDPCPEMDRMKTEIDKSLTGFGFLPQNSRFLPHLTLGRVKDIRQLNQLVQLVTQYKDTFFQSQLVDRIVFYESKLTTTGSIYLPIKEFILK